MDHSYYSKLWFDLQRDLEKVIAYDEIVKETPVIEDRNIVEKHILQLYFRYRKLVQRFTACHDEIIQPQIRECIQKILDYTIVRMLELRQEMVNFSFLDYPWSIDVLLELHWTPDDVELTAPIYNASIRMAESERRKKFFNKSQKLGSIHNNGSIDGETETHSFSSDFSDNISIKSKIEEDKTNKQLKIIKKSTYEEESEINLQELERKTFFNAILLIQMNERARVGRRIAKNVERQIIWRNRGSQKLTKNYANTEEQTIAAIMIQKTWRGFSVRKIIKQKNRRRLEILCITITSGGSNKSIQRVDAIIKEKSDAQVTAVEKLDELTQAEKRRIWNVRASTLEEDIRDEIREWFFEWFEKVGFFDYIPPADVGGSALIASGITRYPDEYVSSLDNDKKLNQKQVEGEDEEKIQDEEAKGWKMQESNVIHNLKEAAKEFRIKWEPHALQILNPAGPLINEFIHENICFKLQLEVRKMVDEVMRFELETLNEALMMDHENGEFRFCIPQDFYPIVSEEHPGHEILPDVSEDDLAMELMRSKVLGDVPECRLRDWPGVPTYTCRVTDATQVGDIKQAVMDYCVLPLGSKAVHKLAPLVRSVCICGPPGSGQIFIVRAICNELKAAVFDLTPAKLMGRYKTMKSQNRLVEAVSRLSRAYAPSIILVENDKAWIKTVPPQLKRLDPKRFLPVYKRIINGILPGDQVLFLTASEQPYLMDRSFIKSHDKFITIPVIDYKTTFLAYKKSLLKQHTIPRDFPVSCLAKTIANETTLEVAQQALNQCLKIKRRMNFKRKSLTPMEILETLQYDENKPTKADLQLFEKFYANLPEVQKRRQLMEQLLQE